MLEFLNQVDTQIFLMLNGAFRSEFLDHFMELFTGKFIWAPMYAAILFILFKNFKPWKAMICVVGIVLSIVIADQVCATLIRPLVGRLRPSNPDNPLSAFTHIVNGYRGGSYGFPSCHAANSFALATFLSLLIPSKRFRRFILLWATINSLSRLYLGVHYPGDLLAGGIIGSCAGWMCYRLSRLAMIGHKAMARSKADGRISLSVPSGLTSVIEWHATLSLPVSDIMIGIGALTLLWISAHAILA